MTPQQVVEATIDSVKTGVETVREVRWREVMPYMGPAFLVSVGYMDPGNWGTNIEGGSMRVEVGNNERFVSKKLSDNIFVEKKEV